MVIFGFGLWMPSLVKQSIDQGVAVAGLPTAVPFVFAAVSMDFKARFSDRSRISRGWFVAVPNTVAGLALLAQHYGPNTLGRTMAMFCIAGAGLHSGAGTWWSWALSSSRATRRVRRSAS